MKPLPLSTFQKKYKHHINSDTVITTFGRFISNQVKLDFDVYLSSKGKNLQRELCWTLLQKQQLILSMLRGVKLPKFVVVEHNTSESERLFLVIDGKQRFNTVFEFMRNEFPIIVDNQVYFFTDLDTQAQNAISYAYPLFDIHYSYFDDKISDDTLIDLFEQVNFLGTPQDIQHLNNLKS